MELLHSERYHRFVSTVTPHNGRDLHLPFTLPCPWGPLSPPTVPRIEGPQSHGHGGALGGDRDHHPPPPLGIQGGALGAIRSPAGSTPRSIASPVDVVDPGAAGLIPAMGWRSGNTLRGRGSRLGRERRGNPGGSGSDSGSDYAPPPPQPS